MRMWGKGRGSEENLPYNSKSSVSNRSIRLHVLWNSWCTEIWCSRSSGQNSLGSGSSTALSLDQRHWNWHRNSTRLSSGVHGRHKIHFFLGKITAFFLSTNQQLFFSFQLSTNKKYTFLLKIFRFKLVFNLISTNLTRFHWFSIHFSLIYTKKFDKIRFFSFFPRNFYSFSFRARTTATNC